MNIIPTRRSKLFAQVAPIVAVVGLAAGCASAPVSYPELDQARAEVAAARSSPDAARYAQLELQKADDLLHSADEAARAHQADEVAHESYLASQTSKVALAVGADKAAQAHIAQGDSERARIELAARTREAESASARADSATIRAETAESAAREAQAGQERFEQELATLQAQKSARGLVITLRDVLFATGRAELQPGAELTLDKLAAALKDAPDRAVDVDGFTDIVGSEEFNLILSQRRAEAVRTALMVRGIDSTRITVHGYGKDYPVATNETEAGRQLNRRVEIVVADGNGSIPPRQALNQ